MPLSPFSSTTDKDVEDARNWAAESSGRLARMSPEERIKLIDEMGLRPSFKQLERAIRAAMEEELRRKKSSPTLKEGWKQPSGRRIPHHCS